MGNPKIRGHENATQDNPNSKAVSSATSGSTCFWVCNVDKRGVALSNAARFKSNSNFFQLQKNTEPVQCTSQSVRQQTSLTGLTGLQEEGRKN